MWRLPPDIRTGVAGTPLCLAVLEPPFCGRRDHEQERLFLQKPLRRTQIVRRYVAAPLPGTPKQVNLIVMGCAEWIPRLAGVRATTTMRSAQSDTSAAQPAAGNAG